MRFAGRVLGEDRVAQRLASGPDDSCVFAGSEAGCFVSFSEPLAFGADLSLGDEVLGDEAFGVNFLRTAAGRASVQAQAWLRAKPHS